MTGPHSATRDGDGATRLRPGQGSRPATSGDGPWRGRAVMAARRHGLLAALLAAGLILRAATQVAYHPALIFIDSLKYLYGEYPGADPLGYRVLLKIILVFGDLGVVAAIQHLLGLAMAVALYAVLVRRGAARWWAALAVVPVLLDGYQLQMEHMIMPGVWFEAMIVAGLAALLWRPAVTVPAAIAAGLILGSAATFQQVGEVLVLPALLYVLVASGGWRRAIGGSAALGVAFALPILGYAAASDLQTGHFWLAAGQPHSGRMAAAADCATLRLPAAVRPLCPTPAQRARGPDWLEHSRYSPLHAAAIPRGANRPALIAALTSAVERQQPGRVAAAIARDSVRLFAITRAQTPGATPISRWQFQNSYPTFPPAVTVGPGRAIIVGVQWRVFGPFRQSRLRPSYGGAAQVNRPVAAFLRSYQLDGGYTPGPLLALLALAGLAGSALVVARRARAGARVAASRQLALGGLLFTATAAAVLLVPDALEFSWRYQLPALVTLPPAGMLGIAAVASRLRDRRPDRGPPAPPASVADSSGLPL